LRDSRGPFAHVADESNSEAIATARVVRDARPVISYILPIRSASPPDSELDVYLKWLSATVDLIVVDGSPATVFSVYEQRWSGFPLRHVTVDSNVAALLNGKVAGVLTGLRLARFDRVVVADDDVRYNADGLRRMEAELSDADVVRPQNYFNPLPWHACFDASRTLLNRMTGGDWPGTLGVRRNVVLAAGGYDGDVLFENLELVRTIVAAGGRERCLLDLYVERRPPSASHFWSQRIRQAYDEFARPARFALWLAVVPVLLTLAAHGRWKSLTAGAATIVLIAEAGRQRKGGGRVFPIVASLGAPLWVLERGICAWIAAAARLILGGIPYRNRIISRAATPVGVLARRSRIAREVAG
jgi:hypothetical protein